MLIHCINFVISHYFCNVERLCLNTMFSIKCFLLLYLFDFWWNFIFGLYYIFYEKYFFWMGRAPPFENDWVCYQHSIDQSWMNARHLSEEYEKGVSKFLKYAEEHANCVNGTYYCPCVRCLNQICHTLSVDLGRSQVYGFFEPQSIQLSDNTKVQSRKYMVDWITTSQRRIFLAPYIEGLVLLSKILLLS